MSRNIQQTNLAALFQHSPDDLLQAHQSLIKEWFEDWGKDERARAQEVLRKRQSSDGIKNRQPGSR